jgi:uncharacterized protein YlxW (UPF0749 family)
MKLHLSVVLLTLLVSAYVTPVSAQETAEAGRRVDELRAELNNTQDRVTDLKIRLEQLNFDLRPENIERYFNGFGTTRPEELRESRRRQLQIEKDRVVAQIQHLEVSCSRLEAAISTAQSRAYQESMITTAMKAGQNPELNILSLTLVTISIAMLCAILGAIGLRSLIRRRRHL